MKSTWARVGIILAGLMLTVLSLMGGATAHASNPVPYPHALDSGRTLGVNLTGSQLPTSFVENASNSPGNCTNPRTAGISTQGNNVILTSNGTDCLYLQSPHTYPTIDGYVYEAEINVSSWTPWSAFWGYGNNWPVDGEIDAVEASPTGQNNISWHDSTSNPQGYSTCNNQDGCDANMPPITTPSNAQSLAQGLSPGTHIVDFAFGTCGSGCGAVSVWYDGTETGFVSGTNVLNGGSQNDPFWLDFSTGQPEFGSCGNPCGTLTVVYMRGWS